VNFYEKNSTYLPYKRYIYIYIYTITQVDEFPINIWYLFTLLIDDDRMRSNTFSCKYLHELLYIYIYINVFHAFFTAFYTHRALSLAKICDSHFV